MVQPENAEQIKAYYEEQKGPPNTSANSDSDKTTDSNHQPSDCSTALLQHSDASEDRFKEQRHITVQIWVCIGISAIGLGCAVVLMMIQKKK